MKKINDYVKIYSNAISLEICDKTIEELESTNFIKHKFYSQSENKYYENENEPFNSFDILNIEKKLMEIIYDKLKDYLKDINHSWFGGWNGYSKLKYLKYTKNTKMNFHWDAITELFDGQRKGIPTLTVIGLLNDDFKGGDFIIFENKKIKLKKGDLIIFPSTFLYPHGVNLIKNGIRYSFVSWVW